MKTEKEIKEEAREAYERNFTDFQRKEVKKEINDDVLLDQKKMFKDVEDLKEKEIVKHESLELLRTQLETEAKSALNEVFDEKEDSSPKRKMNTKEMENYLMNKKEHLLQEFNQQKQKEMSKAK